MERISVGFSELSSLNLSLEKEYELVVTLNEIDYYLMVYLKDLNDKFLIMSNGAVDPSKKAPPIYMRSSWIDQINASCIFIDDPTLHNTDMRLGWGQGNRENFSLENISYILKELFKNFNVHDKNIYFYGSSAGGFMSLFYSILFPESTAIVNNPQTKVLNYLAPYVKKMLLNSYGIKDINNVDDEILYRLDINEAIKHYNIIPKKIYYLQNFLCENDLDNHVTPFLNDLKKDNIEIRGLHFVNYFRENLGHNPLPQRITLQYIHLILENKLDMNL